MADPTMSLEFGFVSPADTGTYLTLGDAARGKLGTGTLGPDELWTDVTADLRAWDIHRTSSRMIGPLTHYDAGTASFKLSNAERQYDPSNLNGPYVSAGVTQVTPMRAVRLRATYAGVTYEVWRGFVDAWRISYMMPRYSEVVATATDAFKVFQAQDRTAVTPVGAGEDTGARVDRILDSAAWPAEDRLLSTGDSALQATDLSGNVLSELTSTVDSELGELYIDGGGRVVFRNRHAMLTETRSNTSQHTFGISGLPYADLTPEYDDTQLANAVHATREGGTEQVVTDSTSVSQYLSHTASSSSLLLATDADALQWAGWVLYQSKDPELRFASLVIQPQRSPAALYPVVLGIELGDRITVQLQPPGGGDPIVQDVFVRSIEHTQDDRHMWTTTLGLQSATKFAFLVLDNATLGQLGHNALVF